MMTAVYSHLNCFLIPSGALMEPANLDRVPRLNSFLHLRLGKMAVSYFFRNDLIPHDINRMSLTSSLPDI